MSSTLRSCVIIARNVSPLRASRSLASVATAVAIRKMNRQFPDVRRHVFDPFEAMIERAEHADLIQRANELTPMPTSYVSDLMGCVGPILEDETEWQDLRFPNLSQWTKSNLPGYRTKVLSPSIIPDASNSRHLRLLTK